MTGGYTMQSETQVKFVLHRQYRLLTSQMQLVCLGMFSLCWLTICWLFFFIAMQHSVCSCLLICLLISFSVSLHFSEDKFKLGSATCKSAWSAIADQNIRYWLQNMMCHWYSDFRADNGSMGHGSRVKWVTISTWVTWVMGQRVLTHDPSVFFIKPFSVLSL